MKIVIHNPESVKKEAVETGMEEEEEIPDSPVEEDLAVAVSSPVSDANPLVVSGKRKRKPKEILYSPIIRSRKKSSSSKSKDGASDGGTSRSQKVVASIGGSGTAVKIKSPTTIQAKEFMLSLSNEQPSFFKLCLRSHVGSCFWMGLPVPFCKLHLPGTDAEVILENENGKEFPVKYIANKTGLSAGWRNFVAENKYVEGDSLVFQLTGPCIFKVYAIRANDLTAVDGALSLLNLDSQTKQNDDEATVVAPSKKKRRPKSLALTVVQKKKGKAGPAESGHDSDEVASEVLEGAKCSSSSLRFKDVKSFDDFHIMVNGACIDSDLPEDIRRNYYELCLSKGSFLHDRLLPGLYSKLAAGMIVETIFIVDSLRGCNPSTPKEDFEIWEKSLRSFELLGLNVGFVRSRLQKLQRLAFETEDVLEIRRYRKAQKEQSQARDEINKLEAKLVQLRESYDKCDHEVEVLRMKAESYQLKFQEEVEAPW